MTASAARARPASGGSVLATEDGFSVVVRIDPLVASVIRLVEAP